MDFTEGPSSWFQSSRNACSFFSGNRQQPSILLWAGVFKYLFPANLCVEKKNQRFLHTLVFNKFNLVLLNLYYECKSPGHLVKMLTLVQQIWGPAWHFAFPLLLHRRGHTLRSRDLTNNTCFPSLHQTLHFSQNASTVKPFQSWNQGCDPELVVWLL